ncbi:GWxTD domain-containing protein [Bacteroidota bacterium]
MRYIWRISLILVGITSCTGSSNVGTATSGIASLYNPSEYSLNIDYQVYHISDDLTSLYIRLYPSQLLFNQANIDAEYRALVDIHYTLYALDSIGKVKSVADSSRFRIKLGKEDEELSSFFISKALQIPEGSTYLIRFDSRDVQRGTVGLSHMYIDKRDVYSAQNFSIISRNGYPKFLYYFKTGEVFRIDYRLPHNDSVYLDFYRSDSLYPRPQVTFTSETRYPLIPDTTLIIPFSDSLLLTLPEEGMYHLRIDTAFDSGLTLLNLGMDYPRTRTEQSLLDPLFYIATITEYQQLITADNLKRAVDDFWLRRTNAKDRSRELIRVYYNRVLYSNLYFTAEREGWKTDRGMLFILFGPPDRIRDDGNMEYWYYISKRQGRIIEFVFERQPSNFSNQDLVWKKNRENMQYWSEAVGAWRSGKAFSLGK